MSTRPLSEIPLLPSRHLFGHLPELRKEPLSFLKRVMSERGERARVRLGTTTALFLGCPQLIQQLLVDHAYDYEKNRSLTVFARPVLGDGLVTSQGAKHRTRRAIVAPAFQPRRIRRFVDTIAGETDRVLDSLLKTTSTDLNEAMTRLTLHVVTSTLLRTEVEGDVQRVGEAFTAVSEALMNLVRSPLPLPPRFPTPSGRKLLRAAGELDAIVRRILHERRRDDTGYDDVLAMLLEGRDETGAQLSIEDLRDEVMTLLLAGHETTANALTWALQLVATTPRVAKKLRSEVDQALGSRPPRYEDLAALPYCLQIIKEALRLYPPAYLVGRIATQDTALGDFHIPKGQLVFANVYGLHHWARFHPDPERFEPERFDDQAEKRWQRNTYLPFGTGPRVCVGNHFALMEAQVVLARFSQRLELSGAISGLAKPAPLITLRPEPPVLMQVRPRREAQAAQPRPGD